MPVCCRWHSGKFLPKKLKSAHSASFKLQGVQRLSHRVTIFRSLPEQAWILERDALEAGPELVALVVARDADLAELAGISVLGAVAPVARAFSVAGANQT